VARRKKTDAKTLTMWGVRYTFDENSKKWMEGKKEASPLLSAMLEDLYEQFEKNKTPPQDREETEIILSPLPEEKSDEAVQDVKQDAKLERAEAEQKVKASSDTEKFEIVKPNIEVESLVKPTESTSKDKSERRLPRLESAIAPEILKERVQNVSMSSLMQKERRETPQQDQTLNLFSDILKRMQETNVKSAGSDQFKEAITNLNKTLGIFAAKQDQKSESSEIKTEKEFERIADTEKSTVYLKSIDERINEILNYLKTEEKEEDALETEAEAEASKRKLEESYKATGAELSASVNDAILGPADARDRKGLLDSRLGKQIDANFARRLDESLPILNLFTDKLDEMRQDASGESASGITILGGAFGGIGRGIKRGAGSIYRAGAAGARGIGKVASSAGSMLSGAAKNIFKGAGALGSGVLKKGGSLARGAGSMLSGAAKSIGTLGKTVGLGTVGLATGALGAMASSKSAGTSLAKSAGKSVIKKIPILGALAGLGFGAQRALSGDFSGAAMEVGSGLASTVPGIGTAASLGIDAALAAKDAGAFESDQVEMPEEDQMPIAQQKPKITNQTVALKEFESQRRMIQDKKSNANQSSTTIINNNKSETSGRGGASGILPTAGTTRSLYLHYYAT